MIPVSQAPEPATFDTKVRQPGAAFLTRHPRPSNRDFQSASHWKECLPDLVTGYKGICAYSACWIPTQASVDHFHPKSISPNLAYEWSNLRLASDKINSYKGDARGIADPFSVRPGWFILDFSTFYVRTGQGLPKRVYKVIDRTIKVLRLNHNALVDQRYALVKDYAKGLIGMVYLEERYPFIASELTRQGLAVTIKTTFP